MQTIPSTNIEPKIASPKSQIQKPKVSPGAELAGMVAGLRATKWLVPLVTLAAVTALLLLAGCDFSK